MKHISIVGQKFRGLDPYLPGIETGTEAILVREPFNQYDANAVAVWIEGKHVGYLPKADNTPIAVKIDATGAPWSPPDNARTDSADVTRAITVKMVRSPNTGYPQVEIQE